MRVVRCVPFWLSIVLTIVCIRVPALGQDISEIRKQAEAGKAQAQYALGRAYAKGEGTTKNDAEAVRWLRKAADQGYAKAQDALGYAYAEGRGVAKNDAEAVRMFRKAADRGEAWAQYNLGVAYSKGQGVSKDDSEAVRWLRKAAEQGHAKAQFNLGYAYANGEGVVKDETEAARWYHKAAEQGNADAQHNLSLMSINGQGIAKDESGARSDDSTPQTPQVPPKLSRLEAALQDVRQQNAEHRFQRLSECQAAYTRDMSNANQEVTVAQDKARKWAEWAAVNKPRHDALLADYEEISKGVVYEKAFVFGLGLAAGFALIFALYKTVRTMLRAIRSGQFTADRKRLVILLLAALWISAAVIASFNDDDNRSGGRYGRLQFPSAAIEVVLLSIPIVLLGGVCLWWIGRNRQQPAPVTNPPSATVTINGNEIETSRKK